MRTQHYTYFKQYINATSQHCKQYIIACNISVTTPCTQHTHAHKPRTCAGRGRDEHYSWPFPALICSQVLRTAPTRTPTSAFGPKRALESGTTARVRAARVWLLGNQAHLAEGSSGDRSGRDNAAPPQRPAAIMSESSTQQRQSRQGVHRRWPRCDRSPERSLLPGAPTPWLAAPGRSRAAQMPVHRDFQHTPRPRSSRAGDAAPEKSRAPAPAALSHVPT